MDGMPVSSLMAGMFMFSADARGQLPGVLGGSSSGGAVPITTVNHTWVNRYLDEVDPNRPYTFEYTDPDTGVTSTYQDNTSLVSTNQGYFTTVSISDTWITIRRMIPGEIESSRNEIEKLLTERCVNFLNSLIRTTTGKNYNAKTDLPVDLMKIANFKESGLWRESGIFYHSDLRNNGGMQGGSLEAGTAALYVAGEYSPLHASVPANISRVASITFNELIHAAGAISDVEGTRTIVEMGIIPVSSSGKPISYPEGPASYNSPYSNYFHTAIKNACEPNQ